MVQNFSSDLFAMTHDAEVDMDNIMDALNTLKSSFSGPSAPSAEQGQLWYDTTRSLLRHRGATSQWRGVIAFKDDGNYLNITKIWVYANAAEEGFTEDDDCADSVIALKGGAQAYNVTGGDGVKKGVWAITGISSESSHTHPIPHTHTMAAGSQLGVRLRCDDTLGGALLIDAGPDASGKLATGTISEPASSSNTVSQVSKTTATTNTPNSSAGTSHTHTQGGTWRPQAAVGIMIYPAII